MPIGDEVEMWTNSRGETVHMLVEIGPCEEGKWVHDDSTETAIAGEATEDREDEELSVDENECTMYIDVESTADAPIPCLLRTGGSGVQWDTDDRPLLESVNTSSLVGRRPNANPHCAAGNLLPVVKSNSVCTKCTCDAGGPCICTSRGDAPITSPEVSMNPDDNRCSLRCTCDGCQPYLIGTGQSSSIAVDGVLSIAEQSASDAVGVVLSSADDKHSSANTSRNQPGKAITCCLDDFLHKPDDESSASVPANPSRLGMNDDSNVHSSGATAAGSHKRTGGASVVLLPSVGDDTGPLAKSDNGSAMPGQCKLQSSMCFSPGRGSNRCTSSKRHIARAGDTVLPASNYVFQARRHPGGDLENFRIINSKLPPNFLDKGLCLEIENDGCFTHLRDIHGDGTDISGPLHSSFSSFSDVGRSHAGACNTSNKIDGHIMAKSNISTDVHTSLTCLPGATQPDLPRASQPLTSAPPAHTADGLVYVASPVTRASLTASSTKKYRLLRSTCPGNRIMEKPYMRLPARNLKLAAGAVAASGNSTATVSLLLLQPCTLPRVDAAAASRTRSAGSLHCSSPQLTGREGPPKGPRDDQPVGESEVGDHWHEQPGRGPSLTDRYRDLKHVMPSSESAVDSRHKPQSDRCKRGYHGEDVHFSEPAVQPVPNHCDNSKANTPKVQYDTGREKDHVLCPRQRAPHHVGEGGHSQSNSMALTNHQQCQLKEHLSSYTTHSQHKPGPVRDAEVHYRQHSNVMAVADRKDNERDQTQTSSRSVLRRYDPRDHHKVRHDLNLKEGAGSSERPHHPAPTHQRENVKSPEAMTIRSEANQGRDKESRQETPDAGAQARQQVEKRCACCHLRFCPHKTY